MALTGNMRGAGLMAAATASFAVNDTLIKLLAGAVPLFQVITIRGLLTCLLIGWLCWLKRAFVRGLSRRDWALMVARGGAEAGATFFFLNALFNMPLANITAMLQALPLTVTLAGALFLGERVGWRRYVAIAVGFCGVMLIVQPGTAGFSVYALYGLGAVAFATLRDLLSRRLSPEVPSLLAILATAVCVTLLGLCWSAIADPWVAPALRDWALMVSASGAIFCAYLLILMAMRVGEVGFVAPFRYMGLVTAMILGFLVFGDWPDGLTLAGAGIVVGSGLFTLWRERKVRDE